MRLLSQAISHRQGVVVIPDLEVQEEESQVSQETDEALIVSLETVFLNQEEAAQDQATVAENQTLVDQEDQATEANQRLVRLEGLKEADLESQILAEMENQVVAEDQMLVAQENQATAANQRLAQLEDQAAGNQNLLVIQQINRLTRTKDQSQKLVGKRTKPFLSPSVINR